MADGLPMPQRAADLVLARVSPGMANDISQLLEPFGCKVDAPSNGNEGKALVRAPFEVRWIEIPLLNGIFKVYRWDFLPRGLRVVVLTEPELEDVVRLSNQPKLTFLATQLGMSPEAIEAIRRLDPSVIE